MFDPVNPRQSFPDLEKGILQYWKEEDMFRRSIEIRNGREEFSFYDGPPFATGLPHYGHLLAGTIKDVIPRYQTMRGKKVQRRFGWDCHGLPIENLIEKEHDIKSKQDIEAMGVRRFNDLCRGTVQRYVQEWRYSVERMGRWVDMDRDYRTMDAPYMESIWWVFDALYEKKLIYEGHKPMHICPRCVTPLSNFEVTQGYKDISDLSAVVRFEVQSEELKVKSDGKIYLLAWTTTPWTLPGNLFVAVGSKITYVKVVHEGNTYILAKDRVEQVFKDKEHTVEKKTIKGSALKGLTYVPLFPYFVDRYPDAFRVVTGDFVSTEEGTGIVHIAPGFGEDDFHVWKEEAARSPKSEVLSPLLQHVTMEGKFVDAVKDFAGLDVKPIDDPSKADRKIVEWLEKHGKLFSKQSYRHSFPHCWRCDSPLLNYATSSWFVKVEEIKLDMLDANAKTAWVPSHLRDGRFGNWLENARDWAISRNRYWGTPLPIWRVEGNEKFKMKNEKLMDMEVIGSRDELMQRNQIRFSKVTAIRHGEAEHNLVPYYQSAVPGVALTEKGRRQAQAAGEYLAQQNVTVIYSSPLQRTLQTAQAIADATGAQIIIDERLREVEAHAYEGKTFDVSDLAMVKLRRQQKFQENTPAGVWHLEGMEPWVDVQKRVHDFLSNILPRHRSDHVVLVTHGDPMLCIEHFFTLEDPFKMSHRAMAPNAMPVSFFWDHDTNAQMDLHKENVDEIWWPAHNAETVVDVVCVRHGATALNQQNIIQGGNVNEPLNDLGRDQAKQLAKKLQSSTQSFDLIISSDLSRAVETAQILADALKIPYQEKWELLRERDAGKWSGQPVDDVLAKFPSYPPKVNPAFHYGLPEQGESLSQFLQRMKKGYQELLQRFPGKRILLVSHRGVMQGLNAISNNLSYTEALALQVDNAGTLELSIKPLMQRIPEVLDCWFESGSMPYAQQHFPFEMNHQTIPKNKKQKNNSQFSILNSQLPPGFPADFIAEGVDQTRGWFYTLTVLSSALYKEPAFKNNVVNGIVLAEDGRKMSKRLKNYPEPTEIADNYGADALRFALMYSPAVRGENVRFSEKAVEETLRNVLLPLWNSYSFFVTYANLAKFEPSAKPSSSGHPLDRWINAEMQDLVNRMTAQLDAYDLSATCGELFETIDVLTNWYIRLSRRRFAGKATGTDLPEAEPENFEQDRHDALTTLYDVLLTVSQLLAPFCPFVTDAIYLNLVNEPNGSIHLTDWPQTRTLEKGEKALIDTNRLLRSIVSLGLKIRSEQKIKVRTPLASATIAYPSSLLDVPLGDDALHLLQQELNVKKIQFTEDPGSLGEAYVQVDSRKVGPRLGKRVQEIIQAGKRGEFEQLEDGHILILDESLAPDEAAILYRGREGQNIAAERGVVISIDTAVSAELELEGLARDLIRAIQKLRKEQGYDLGETVTIGLGKEAEDILKTYRTLIEQETCVTIAKQEGPGHDVPVGEETFTIFLHPKA